MDCHDCHQEVGTVFITCSAHKDRAKVCKTCWNARDETTRDDCVEFACHGRVHAVKKNRVFRSYDYFKKHAREVLLFVALVIGLMSILLLIFLPFLSFHEMKQKEEEEELAIGYVLFYILQLFLYSSMAMMVHFFAFIEWMDGRSSNAIKDFHKHGIFAITESMYGIELLFCALLFLAPSWKYTIVHSGWIIFVLMDVVYLFFLRHLISSTLSEMYQRMYDWFTEVQEEHLFLEETPHE